MMMMMMVMVMMMVMMMTISGSACSSRLLAGTAVSSGLVEKTDGDDDNDDGDDGDYFRISQQQSPASRDGCELWVSGGDRW